MKNKPAAVILSAQKYQDITGYDRGHMPRHTMDWSNVPRQTKSYPALPAVALEPKSGMPGRSFWQVMQEPESASWNMSLDIQSLSAVLGLAYGYTARQRLGGQEYLYRSVPSAGALYPVEIYVSGDGISGLPPGLFHYNIQEFILQQLRGEHESTFIAETLGIPKSENSWMSFILSGIFFRSSWKYRERAFRYVLLDTGHLVENLASALAFEGLPCSVRYDFADERLCSLVGLDRVKEACFAIVDVRPGRTLNGIGGGHSGLEPMALGAEVAGASRVSSQEVTYDVVKQIYFASSKLRGGENPNDETSWVTSLEAREWFPVRQAEAENLATDYIGVIQGRRSRRNFVREPIPSMSFMRLLSMLGATAAPDPHSNPCSTPVATGFLVGHVEGFDQGFYRYAGESRMYGLLESGFFVEKMVAICLDQGWLANAGALFLFMANLKALDDSCGARGYRYAMMEAGILGQRLYLGSTALGLGCCGIGAFYDAEARDLLSLNDDSYLLYLVAVGNIGSTVPGPEIFS